ncbi:MAG: hypothetical protein E7606_05050 [Ruminococcaceae bacterium]|nr:hypothetical protein [Oscillospiraceae bacterium]
MAKKTNSELFSALLYIVVGVLLAVFPGKALAWAMTVAGVVFVVSGVLDIIKSNVKSGVISLIIGAAILVLGWTVTGIVLLVLGILIAVKGAIALLDALKKSNKGLMDLLFPILTIVVGILLAFGNALEIMVIIGGILLAVNGVVGLVGALKK